MRAAVWHGRHDVRVEKVAEPPPPSVGQVQVKVSWCGICGTDLHEYVAGPLYIPLERPHRVTGVRAPVVIGHELSGEVAAVGEGVTNFSEGDRVAICPIIGCGGCRWCRSDSMAQCDQVAFVGTSWTGGGLAERLNVNAYQCFHLNDAISDELGALVEPFSATVRAIAQGHPCCDDNVAIIGAGPIGLMALMAARLCGIKRVVTFETSEQRIETAMLCGADAVIDTTRDNSVNRALAITEGIGFDLVLECAGQPDAVMMAAKLTRTRGRLMIMGVFDRPAPIDLTDLVFREKTVSGSMSGYGFYEKTIRLMSDARFRGDLLITDRIGLDDVVSQGYHGLLHEKHKHVKVLVRPD